MKMSINDLLSLPYFKDLSENELIDLMESHRLSDKERLVLKMRYIDSKTYAEIGNKLKLSRSYTCSLDKRAIHRLRYAAMEYKKLA